MSAFQPDSKFMQVQQLFDQIQTTYEIECGSQHCASKFTRISNLRIEGEDVTVITEGDAAYTAMNEGWSVINGRIHCPNCTRVANALRRKSA